MIKRTDGEIVAEYSFELEGDDRKITFVIQNRTLYNKFDKFILPIINENFEYNKEFEIFFFNMFYEYIHSEVIDQITEIKHRDYNIILQNLYKVKEYADKWFETQNFDYTQFADIKKRKHDSIFLTADQIETLIRYSVYLKFYMLIFATNYSMPQEELNKGFEILSEETDDKNIFHDLFEFVQMILNTYKKTNDKLFNLLKKSIGISPDDLIFEIFSFILKNTITSLDITRNPVIYLSVTVKQYIGWFLKSTFDKNVSYLDITNKDEYDNTLLSIEMDSSSESVNSIDFIGDFINDYELTRIIEFIRFNLRKYNINIKEFEKRLAKLNQTPFQLYIVFPMISKIFGFDYTYLTYLDSIQSYYLQIFFKYILNIISYNDNYILQLCNLGSKELFTESKMNVIYKNINYLEKNINLFNYSDIIIVIKMLDNIYKQLESTNYNFYNDTVEIIKQKKKVMQSLLSFFKLYFEDNFNYSYIKSKVLSILNYYNKEDLYSEIDNIVKEIENDTEVV
jgi:hypothetical protein